MEINIKLRSEILEYSLILEKAINDLLLINLGIFDGGHSTRLFGKKASITFKNKIDFLYDTEILSKEENADLELLMIFRNKFLHDIECNSFLSAIEQLDNSIKNKFKLHLNHGQSINNEDSCKTACQNLYLKNIDVIKNKVKCERIKIQERSEVFLLQNKQIIYHHDLFFGLINDLFLILENSELEDEKVRKLSNIISVKCQEYIDKITTDEEIVSLKNRLSLFLADSDKIKNYYGIIKIHNNEISNLLSEVNTISPKYNSKKKIN